MPFRQRNPPSVTAVWTSTPINEPRIVLRAVSRIALVRKPSLPVHFVQLVVEAFSRLPPDISTRIVTRTTLTPLELERDLRSAAGAAFELEPVLTQSAWFRYHNRSEDVEGLYFVGAGTHPGGGVPGVLSSAKALERLLPDAPSPPTSITSV